MKFTIINKIPKHIQMTISIIVITIIAFGFIFATSHLNLQTWLNNLFIIIGILLFISTIFIHIKLRQELYDKFVN